LAADCGIACERTNVQDFYEEALKIKREGKKATLATIVRTQGSTPREVGAKMLVYEDGSISGTIGGGRLEATVIKGALDTLATGEPRLVHYDLTGAEASEVGMICGGTLEVYLEPILTGPKVFLFGGGHVSLPVARLSKMAGFRVAVIDDRPEFANRERFPEAEEVIADEFSSALKKLKPDRESYLVILTRGHACDQEVLEWALGTEARYVGMIGSRKKVQTVFSNLKEKGVSAEKLNSVHSPIGMDIGAQTPEEIAVSIVAELIRERRKGKGRGA
jgi:xanthine dehydrogenase accessory factor